MVPRSLLPARRGAATAIAGALLGASALVGLVPAAPLVPTASAAAAPPVPVEPLEVTIDTLTPGDLPATGEVEVSGTVTNVDDETWTTVNLYPFLSDTPMRTPAELRVARRSDPLAFVGERITSPGPYAVIDSLEPGESAPYSFSVDRERLEVTERGVYWFGVHALGQDSAGRDSTADGRARTFLPLVDRPAQGRRDPGAGTPGTLPVAVVVPLRHRVLHEADGSLAETEEWADQLGDGDLARLVELGAAADGAPLTWLVDPALTAAAARLAAGNPGRSIAPTLDPAAPEGDADASGDPSPSGTAGTDTSEGADPSATASPSAGLLPEEVDPDDLDPEVRELARTAGDWLAELRDTISDAQQVIALPYGDVDVAGAAEQAPGLYEKARRLAGDTLPRVDVETDPGLSSPLGYLDDTALSLVGQDETVLMTDLEVGLDARGEAPALVSVGDRDVVVASSGAAQGGPGPGRRLSAVSMRQRILSEAALRLLEPDPQPLVVVLPPGWAPDDPEALMGGLVDTGWVDLDTVSSATTQADAVDVDPADLRYPASQQVAELSPWLARAVEDQVRTGGVLQDVLTLNDRVGDVVAGEAFSAASYTTRPVRPTARESVLATTGYLRTLLSRIRVTTPPGVTLSSASGRLPATIVNDLDQPVTVRLDATSDLPMSLSVPDEIQVAAGGRQGVLLEATTQQQGVHNVSLLVTSPDGTPLGGSTDLTIRSAQVSGVIWLIIGSGAALLLGAIVVRLVRRVRAARREATA